LLAYQNQFSPAFGTLNNERDDIKPIMHRNQQKKWIESAGVCALNDYAVFAE
jgi:hypothetical protein